MHITLTEKITWFFRSKSSIAINVPVPEPDERRDSMASSLASSRRYSHALAPRFSIRDAPYDEGVVTAVEQETPRPSSLLPPSRKSSRSISRSSGDSQRSDRSVSFPKDLPKGTPASRISRKRTVVEEGKPTKKRTSPSSMPGTRKDSRSSSYSRSPKRVGSGRKKREKHKRKDKRKSDGTF